MLGCRGCYRGLVLAAVIVGGLGVGMGIGGSPIQEQEPPKTKVHDFMEDLNVHFGELKRGRGEPKEYARLVKSAAAMQPLLEAIIRDMPESLKTLKKAESRADQLEAKALLVEALAHAIGLEAALLRKDLEKVKSRLQSLNSLKNQGHERFQPSN